MQFSIKSRIFPKYPEMAQKAIVEANVTYRKFRLLFRYYMHGILRWLKIRTVWFLFNFFSNYGLLVICLTFLLLGSTCARQDAQGVAPYF